MPDCSIVDYAMQLGGKIAYSVDVSTGEVMCHDSIPAGRAGGAAAVTRGVPATRAEAGGLSKPHNSTRAGNVSAYLGGSLVTCRKPSIPDEERKGGGKRGAITWFTPASKRRLMCLTGKIQRSKLPIMITLTYPSEWPAEGKVWKDHLRRWWQRLKRKVKRAGGIWKLEPQKRGAPHFHLLIWGLEGIPLFELKAWVSKSWYQVVGSGDEKHLHAGTRVELIRSRRGVMVYAAKYLGKVQDEIEGWDTPGRFWGVKGGENIPWAELVSYPLTMTQAVKLLRLMRRYMKCRRSNLPGLNMLCDNPDFWHSKLPFLIT